MKILYVDPIVATERSTKYKYYDGVYNELCKFNQVHLHRGPLYNLDQVRLETGFNPDTVIFGLGWFGAQKYFGQITNLDVRTICWIFKPQNDLEKKLEFCKINDIDLIVTPLPDYLEYEKRTGVRTVLFPYGFDPSNFQSRLLQKEYDVGFSGALHQSMLYSNDSFQVKNLRPKLRQFLKSLKNVDIFWNSSDDDATAFVDDYKEYALTINKSKIWLATLAAYGDVTPRFYEVVGSGTLLMCQKVPESYDFLFQDGINCVQFTNLEDFNEKLHFYKDNPEKIDEIASNALEFFHNNWTWRHRAESLISLIEGI